MSKRTMIFVNGIRGETGRLLCDPIPAETFGKLVQTRLLKTRRSALSSFKSTGRLDHQRAYVMAWHMPKLEEPSEAGWGIVIHKKNTRLKEILSPLINHRNGEVFEYDGNKSVEKWIKKNLLGNELPYYLLIAGSPQEISFEFQYMLDVRFAAGRLYFEDEKSYENYISAVIAREKENVVPTEKRAVVCATDWGVEDPTSLSRRYMAEPLAELAQMKGYAVDRLMEYDATEVNLKQAVCREKRPALVYTVTHGMGWDPADKKQKFLQGALCCQDAAAKEPLSTIWKEDGFLTGYEVDKGFDAHGAVWFCFACYGAGTPKYSVFSHWLKDVNYPYKPAKKDFVSWLPMRLLGCEKPALAFIGHVDPAWVHSFLETSKKSPEHWTRRLQPFKNAVEWILNGVPVGHAMKTFNENYATMNSWLVHLIDEFGVKVVEGKEDMVGKNPYWLENLADLWITRTDCQNYLVLGDPAVRVKV